jgi:hypothetical protein
MDVLRQSEMISKLDREKNKNIGGKMDVEKTIFGDIIGKQFIWCGQVEGMDRMGLLNWEPEGRKKRGRTCRNWKDGIYRG